MSVFKKALVGTAAATALAVSATPAMARDRDGGIDAGDVIAGALIIGGIAAVAAAASDNDRNDRYDNRRGYDPRYDGRYDNAYRYNNSRGYAQQAVRQCVAAVERSGSRRYGPTNVTEVRDIDRRRRGFRVKGRLVVDESYRGGRYNRGRYNRGRYNRDYDRGSFECRINRGRVTHVDIDGI